MGGKLFVTPVTGQYMDSKAAIEKYQKLLSTTDELLEGLQEDSPEYEELIAVREQILDNIRQPQ
jgi:hypothetical protein